MTRKLVNPPRTSVPIVEPASVTLKYRSSMLRSAGTAVPCAAMCIPPLSSATPATERGVKPRSPPLTSPRIVQVRVRLAYGGRGGGAARAAALTIAAIPPPPWAQNEEEIQSVAHVAERKRTHEDDDVQADGRSL